VELRSGEGAGEDYGGSVEDGEAAVAFSAEGVVVERLYGRSARPSAMWKGKGIPFQTIAWLARGCHSPLRAW
jgi:hypothetical protein